MKFSIQRDALLAPLQFVSSVVERRHTVPILANLLLSVKDGKLRLVGSDQEVELEVIVDDVEIILEGQTTIPARKLMDICRSLRPETTIDCELVGVHLQFKSGRYRSQLGTLPAEDYPCIEIDSATTAVNISASVFRDVLLKTCFAMAQQDVRYFFNGMLMQVSNNSIVSVATNGQRLATTRLELVVDIDSERGYIVPRKGVLEVQKALKADGSEVSLSFTVNHLRVVTESGTITTKLIDATYPDFESAIPKENQNVLLVDRLDLKEALIRTAILSNETYRNIRLLITKDNLQLQANNPNQEEAEENVTVDYLGDDLDIGFNVEHLIDVLSVVKGSRVSMAFADAGSAVLLSDPDDEASRYVVSPMML